MMLSYNDLVQDSLKRLNSANTDSVRASASRELVDLGVIYNGTTQSGIAYVVPAPWVVRMFPKRS